MNGENQGQTHSDRPYEGIPLNDTPTPPTQGAPPAPRQPPSSQAPQGGQQPPYAQPPQQQFMPPPTGGPPPPQQPYMQLPMPPGPQAPYGEGLPPLPPKEGMSRRKKIVVWTIVVILALGCLTALGFAADRYVFNKSESSGSGTKTSETAKEKAAREAAEKKAASEFKLEDSTAYQEALDDLQRYYYYPYSNEKITAAAQKAVDEAKKKGAKSIQAVEDAGLRALFEALDEEHTVYLTEAEKKRLNEDLAGNFYGVGFMLQEDKEQKRPKVVEVIKGTPSDKAGVKKDDIIMSVNGKDTKGENLFDVVGRIRGKEGTTVVLEVKRPGETKERTFKLKRAKINAPDVESKVIDGKYGYIKVSSFSTGVSKKVREAVNSLKSQGVKGIILDLRNNLGGLLSEAVYLSNVFVNSGVIVSVDSKATGKVSESAAGDAATDMPLVVLTNGNSASSSEIAAGALQDHKRAVLVGTKTYGKGSVQKIYNLSNGGGAKITMALYYLPNGETIDKKGIQPDVVVEQKDNPEKESELQLEKAKQVLENLIRGKPATSMVLKPAA